MTQNDVEAFLTRPDNVRRVLAVKGFHGLKLIKNRGDCGQWVLEYLCPDTQMRQTIRLGTTAHCDLAQAQWLARKFVSKLYLADMGQLVLPFEPSASPTFKDFAADTYLPNVTHRKRSLGTDQSLLKNHLLPRFGERLLSDIKTLDVQQLMRDLAQHGLAPASCNRVLMLLKFMFSCAIKWEIPGVTHNPCQSVSSYTENNQVERFLTAEEARHLRESIHRSDNPLLGPIVQLMMLTGCRRGEALNALKSDFDLVRGSWCVPEPKGGKARHIPLNEQVIQTIEATLRLSRCLVEDYDALPHLFVNPHTRLPFRQIHYSWDRARKRANLADLRMHDLRHSFASALVNSGMTLYDVKEILGHANIKTTQRYAHLSNERLKVAAKHAARYYEQA